MNRFWQYRWWLFAPIGAAYLAGLFVDVMEADAAQYATMSLEMMQTGSYLEIYHRGRDYIDKPPLLFWLSSLSFRLLGVSNFSYKLPSLLFTLVGLFATYRLTRLLHTQTAAYYATLLLASCQAWFMINHDVRTDTLLAASTVFAIWQLVAFIQNGRFLHLVGGALGVAGAMLTKGPIGLMVPALAVGTDLLLKRQWNDIFRWQWLALLGLVAICLLPMLYGLYTQFDLSPHGKQTYNGLVTSGLRFYFWTQSFGRLTGESTWKNDTDAFYFVHTFLWAFLPWSLLFVAALIRRGRALIKNRVWLPGRQEALTLGGILLPALAFSLSKYKLPHYIFVFFPLAAVLAGHYVALLVRAPRLRGLRFWWAVQAATGIALLTAAVLLCVVSFPGTHWLWVALAIATGIFIFAAPRLAGLAGALTVSAVLAVSAVNLILNAAIYPQLLKYQAGTAASHRVVADARARPFVSFPFEFYAMDFYYRRAVPRVDSVAQILDAFAGKEVWVFTDEKGLEGLRAAGCRFTAAHHLEHYHISKLTLRFLNPRTRPATLMHKWLLLVHVPESVQLN